MGLTARELTFVEQHRGAAMITLRPDGSPHAVRVGVALVDGELWSSGTHARVRTGHLRRDPRATLFLGDQAWRWLALDATVTILEGPDVPELSVRLFQVMQRGMDPGPAPGKLLWQGIDRTPEEFRQLMVDERRLIYQFEVHRAYGML
jgi:PPOX class probable F420-dependent enzyme